MSPQPITAGDVMQLSPESCGNRAFAGCMFVVTEPKAFGAQGYVQGLGTRLEQVGPAFYRARWEEMEPTGGRAVWVIA